MERKYERVLITEPYDKDDTKSWLDPVTIYFTIKPELCNDRVVKIRATCKTEYTDRWGRGSKIREHVLCMEYNVGGDYIYLCEDRYTLVDRTGIDALCESIIDHTDYKVARHLDEIIGTKN